MKRSWGKLGIAQSRTFTAARTMRLTMSYTDIEAGHFLVMLLMLQTEGETSQASRTSIQIVFVKIMEVLRPRRNLLVNNVAALRPHTNEGCLLVLDPLSYGYPLTMQKESIRRRHRPQYHRLSSHGLEIRRRRHPHTCFQAFSTFTDGYHV